MKYKVVLAVSLKLPSETRSRVMNLVLPFSALVRGYATATFYNANAALAPNLWREVEANIIVDDNFNGLQSIGLHEAYAGTMASAYKTAVISGDTCAFKFSELRYSITTAISGTKFKVIGRNIFNSLASVISGEYKDKGTRCNRLTIAGESMPVFQFALNANLDGTSHGEGICSNKSFSAEEIAKLVDNMQHARPSFDFSKYKDAPTSGVTIAQVEDMSQVEKISYIRGADDSSEISSLGPSVLDTNIRLTEVLGAYTMKNTL